MTEKDPKIIPSFDVSDIDQEIEDRFEWKGKKYVIREARGKAATTYRNMAAAALRYGPDGKVQSVVNPANIEPTLVAGCTFELTDNEKIPEKPLTVAIVEQWPSRLQKRCFNWIKEVSDLDDDRQDRVLLGKALALAGAPVTLEQLQEFVKPLDDEEFRILKRWLAPTAEEKAKNAPSDTMDGSE